MHLTPPTPIHSFCLTRVYGTPTSHALGTEVDIGDAKTKFLALKKLTV